MNNLKKLQDKWPAPDPDPPAAAPEPVPDPPDRSKPVVLPQQLTSWRQSTSVVELSDYLKQCRHISLATRDGVPVLVFDPPLGAADYVKKSVRLAQACSAWDLLLAASNDLAVLISKKLIRLPAINPVGLTVRESGPDPDDIPDDSKQNGSF